MNIELIENSTIKVTLDKQESQLLTLDYTEFNYTKQTTKQAFDIIWYKVKNKLKINLPKEKTNFRAYPYIDCGIVIYIELLN